MHSCASHYNLALLFEQLDPLLHLSGRLQQKLGMETRALAADAGSRQCRGLGLRRNELRRELR